MRTSLSLMVSPEERGSGVALWGRPLNNLTRAQLCHLQKDPVNTVFAELKNAKPNRFGVVCVSWSPASIDMNGFEIKRDG
jgi:hypothetical protein